MMLNIALTEVTEILLLAHHQPNNRRRDFKNRLKTVFRSYDKIIVKRDIFAECVHKDSREGDGDYHVGEEKNYLAH